MWLCAMFEFRWILVIMFALGTASAENFPRTQIHSYLEFCEDGELRRVSPSNSIETQYPCEEIVQFNFEPGESTKRIRIFGVILQQNSSNGCPTRLWFGHGQCKDVGPGAALTLQKNGLWHENRNGTMTVLFDISSGRIEVFRLPTSVRNTIKVPERTVFYTMGGNIVDFPGSKGNYCLAAYDSNDNRKHISTRILITGGYFNYGGEADGCPLTKYFNSSVQSLALHVDPGFQSCELSCEMSKEEGAGPGPLPLPLDKDRLEKLKYESSVENETIPQGIIDNPLQNITLELFTKETKPFVEDRITTALSSLPLDETDVRLERMKRDKGHRGQLPITCTQSFREKCNRL